MRQPRSTLRRNRRFERVLKVSFLLAILVVISTGHRPAAGVRNAVELLGGAKTVKSLALT